MLRFPQRLVLSGVACALVVAIVLVAGALATGSSEAEQGTMHNCPQAGKWAISVWDGADGTETGEALAMCGEGVVDFAYYLDPETNGWLGYFEGHADISQLLALNGKQGIIAHGAVGAPAATPTPTATPTPSPAPTATPSGQYSFTFGSSYGEPDTFRGTVEEIRMMDSIPDLFGPVTPPVGGQFAVVLMTVTNIGKEGAYVGGLSFKLRDDQGGVFHLLEFSEQVDAQDAAEAYFDRQGTLDVIMPGVTADVVFVFLVPTGTTGLVAESCDVGCSPF